MASGSSILSSVRAKLSGLLGRSEAALRDQRLTPTLDHFLVGQFIGGALRERRPFLASRLGWTESNCIGVFLETGEADEAFLNKMWLHTGVFPATRKQFARFAETYLGALERADLLGLMNAPYETVHIRSRCPGAALTDLGSLEPYLGPEPWSRHLAGLDVLVVHPFTASIEDQYRNRREAIFTNPDVLPAFNLKTLRPPLTLGGNSEGHGSWSESFDALSQAVASQTFDAAIVGCGAYGLPIGAVIKKLGKPCIHLGGATQLLFGITGTRWREQPAFRALQTSAWRSPLESERPANWNKIENGCYW